MTPTASLTLTDSAATETLVRNSCSPALFLDRTMSLPFTSRVLETSRRRGGCGCGEIGRRLQSGVEVVRDDVADGACVGPCEFSSRESVKERSEKREREREERERKRCIVCTWTVGSPFLICRCRFLSLSSLGSRTLLTM